MLQNVCANTPLAQNRIRRREAEKSFSMTSWGGGQLRRYVKILHANLHYRRSTSASFRQMDVTDPRRSLSVRRSDAWHLGYIRDAPTDMSQQWCSIPRCDLIPFDSTFFRLTYGHQETKAYMKQNKTKTKSNTTKIVNYIIVRSDRTR